MAEGSVVQKLWSEHCVQRDGGSQQVTDAIRPRISYRVHALRGLAQVLSGNGSQSGHPS
jgi:hypothetical protein